MTTDPYIGLVQAGTKTKTATMTTGYVNIIPENASRAGWDMQNISATNITVRLGESGGPEYVLTQYGTFSRNKKTGSIWNGNIYAKGASGGEVLEAEEH